MYCRSMYLRCDSHFVLSNSLSGASVTVAYTLSPSIRYFPFDNVSRSLLLMNSKALSQAALFLLYWVAKAILSVDSCGVCFSFLLHGLCLNQLFALVLSQLPVFEFWAAAKFPADVISIQNKMAPGAINFFILVII